MRSSAGFALHRRALRNAFGSLLVFAGAWGALSPPASAGEGLGFLRGDANSDGAIDIADAVTTLLHLFQGAPCDCLAAADVDASGSLEVTDPIALLGYIFLGGPPPASPFPSCAEAEGAGAGLGCEKPSCELAAADELLWVCRRQDCLQCEPCSEPSLGEIVKLLEEEGIEVHDASYRSMVVIALCGAWTGRIYSVLVSAEDAARLPGWSSLACPARE